MLKESEARFWRSTAGLLAVILAICVLANWVHEEAIPKQITLLLFGSLMALGAGGAVVNPATSPVRLSEKSEARLRRIQYVVGFVFSTLLALVLVLTPLADSALAWLFAPLILLPYALLIRAHIVRSKGK